MSDSTNSIFKSARHFFSGTLLSRITGMLRDIAMAFTFGTGESVAAFFVAFRLAHLLRRMLGEGALQSAFIPKFEEFRNDSHERAALFFKNLFSTLSLLLIGVVLVGCISLGGLYFWGDLSPGNREIAGLTALMLPSLIFICLYGLNTSLLQCEKKYFLPSIAPVLFNICWIIGVFTISSMYGLALFVVVGCFLQWLITVPSAIKILNSLGHHHWDWKIQTKDLKKFGKPLLLGMIGIGASQINNAFDVIFARYAESSGPALLWYAIRLQQLPLALFGIALSGAILPPLARAIKANNYTKFQEFLDYGIKKTALFMIPATLFLFFFGSQLIALIFGRGSFSLESIAGTTPCLQAYSLGLIPMALILIMAPAFYSQGDYKTPAKGSILSMALNIGLNSFFILGLGWGAASVALATSISAWMNATYLGINLRQLILKNRDLKRI